MGDDDRPVLQLRTLTRLWLFSRHLHNVGSIRLFEPISHRLLFWATMIYGPWTLLTGIVGVPWSGNGLTVHLLLPGVAVWWVVRLVDTGTRPDELALSWLRYAAACRPGAGRRRYTSKVRYVR